MGLYVAGNSLGGVGGRVLSSLVAGGTSWRWGVAAVAAGALLATAAFWWLLPEPVGDAEAEAPDGGGGAYGALLRRPAMLALLLVPVTLMGGFVTVYNYLSYRLVAPPFDLPLAVVGLVFLAYLAGTGSSTVAGRAADALGRPRVVLVSVLVMAAGLGPDAARPAAVGDRRARRVHGRLLRRARHLERLGTGGRRAVRDPRQRAVRLRLLRRLQRVRHRARRRLVEPGAGRPSSGPSVRWCWSGRWRRVAVAAQTRTAISSPSRAPSSRSRRTPDQKLPGS